MLLRLLLILSISLYSGCADAPDDSGDAAELDAAPELGKSEQALVIAGFPASISTQGRVVSNPSGLSWTSSAVTMSKNGGVVWGTQPYQACAACGIQLTARSFAGNCTLRAAGGWTCDGLTIDCPTIDTARLPDQYQLTAGGAWASWSPDGTSSWYLVSGNPVAKVTQSGANGYAFNWTLQCGYAAQSTLALGHY